MAASPIVSVKVDGGNITCTPDPVPVKHGKAVITFNLESPGYTFPKTNAIVIDPYAGPDFPDPAKTVRDQQVTLLDLCSFTAAYKYSVTVVDADGKSITLDPTVENGFP